MFCRRLATRLPALASMSSCTCQMRFGSHTSQTERGAAPPPPPTSDAAPAGETTPSASVNDDQSRDKRTQGEGAVADTPATPTTVGGASADDDLTVAEPVPLRWVQEAYTDPDTAPIVDDKGEYIVSKGNWPTGEVAYTTPAPVDDKLAPRFGYNVVSVRKHVSWWKYNQKYPSFSLAYVNIQVIFILGIAWLCAFLTEEYRRATDEMKTPGAMVGEHRGRGPETSKTQKIAFTTREMGDLVNRAQDNWMDGKAEASYVGSKEYQMRKISRPKEFSVDDFRKR